MAVTEQILTWVYDAANKLLNFSMQGRTPTAPNDIASATFERDAAGLGVQRVLDAAPWGYDATYGDKKVATGRVIPVQLTTHNAVSIAANALGAEISLSMKGYTKAIILVKSDQAYDLNYRIGDGVVNGMQQALVSAQTATGADARPHPLVVGGVWLFGDTLKIQPKNVGGAAATMTVTVYLVP